MSRNTNKHICSLRPQDERPERKTCWGKVFGYFEDIILISDRNPRAMLYFRSYTAIQTERSRQLHCKHRVIHPFSEFRRYFEYIMICMFLCNLVLTPWYMFCDALYSSQMGVTEHIYLVSAFTFNMVDIIAACYTGYQDEVTDEVVLEFKSIRRHYLKSFLFASDVIATMPLEIVIAHLPYTHAYHVRWVNVLSLNKLFRLPTTIIYINNVADIWQLNPSLYHALRYFIYAALILHWTTCLSVVFTSYFYIYHLKRTQQNWIRAMYVGPVRTRMVIYILAVFRITAQLMGVTHGLYPNLTIEDQLFTVGLFMVGFFLMGLLLVLILQMMMSAAGPQLMNLAFMNQLQTYMTRIKLPHGKREKLVNYYKYLFREHSFYDAGTLQLLSEPLQQEVVMHTYRHLVRNISIMAEFPIENINNMLNYVEKEIYMPGDYITRSGTPGSCMYFILNGTVAVYTYYGVEICHLHDGAYFGEMALLLNESHRMTNNVALEISEICRLDKRHFLLCVDPESLPYKRLLEQALFRQRYLEQLRILHRTRLRTSNVSKRSQIVEDVEEDECMPRRTFSNPHLKR